MISTHTPLAGRDALVTYLRPASEEFLLTRPLRDVTGGLAVVTDYPIISTHTPLAGRDGFDNHDLVSCGISTHTPLAGRDRGLPPNAKHEGISTHTPLAGRDDNWQGGFAVMNDFYSHAPCGT